MGIGGGYKPLVFFIFPEFISLCLVAFHFVQLAKLPTKAILQIVVCLERLEPF